MPGWNEELLNSMPVEFIGDNCNIKSKLIDRKKDSNITNGTRPNFFRPSKKFYRTAIDFYSL